jgi:hypothetical protein
MWNSCRSSSNHTIPGTVLVYLKPVAGAGCNLQWIDLVPATGEIFLTWVEVSHLFLNGGRFINGALEAALLNRDADICLPWYKPYVRSDFDAVLELAKGI